MSLPFPPFSPKASGGEQAHLMSGVAFCITSVRLSFGRVKRKQYGERFRILPSTHGLATYLMRGVTVSVSVSVPVPVLDRVPSSRAQSEPYSS